MHNLSDVYFKQLELALLAGVAAPPARAASAATPLASFFHSWTFALRPMLPASVSWHPTSQQYLLEMSSR